MDKLSLKDFKDNKTFIGLTVFFAIVFSATHALEPVYTGFPTGIVVSIIVFPLVAWWFMHFWNTIVTKIIKTKHISYGVAFLLTAALTWIVG